MKKSLYAVAFACLALSPCVVHAQVAAEAATAAASPAVSSSATAAPAAKEDRPLGKKAMLTPEEQQKLRAARKAALQDPAVIAAEAKRAEDPKAYRQTLNEAMIRKDAGVAAILAKQKSERKEAKGGKGGKKAQQ